MHHVETISDFSKNRTGAVTDEGNDRELLFLCMAETVIALEAISESLPPDVPELRAASDWITATEIRRLCMDCNRILLALRAGIPERMN